MRFSELSLREPVYDIFAETIPRFLSNRYGSKYNAGWKRPDTGNFQKWLCNPWLNAVFVPGAERLPLEPVVLEYTTSLKPWLRLAQKAFIVLAIDPATSMLFSTRKFYLTPELPNAIQCAFFGGNHRFRFINVNEQRIYAVLKSGYPERFIKNEIAVRSKYEWLPSPKFITNDAGNTWFAEEIRAGTPVNRLNNHTLSQQAVESAFNGLRRLYDETREKHEIYKYVEQVISTITNLLQRYDSAVQNTVSPMAAALGNLEAEGLGQIELAQTHGDFQSSNILWDTTKSWLIDWEYTGQRSCLYDALVWDLGARNSGHLSTHLYSVVNQTEPSSLLGRVAPRQWNKPGVRRVFLAVFLLEEMQLRLEEIDIPMVKKESTGFKLFYSSWLEAARMVLNV